MKYHIFDTVRGWGAFWEDYGRRGFRLVDIKKLQADCMVFVQCWDGVNVGFIDHDTKTYAEADFPDLQVKEVLNEAMQVVAMHKTTQGFN